MSSKRQSTAPAAPKPPTSISSSVVIAELAALTGTNLITIRSDTVLHPRTKIISANGAVTIGSYCVISERSSIGLQSASLSQHGVTIEDYVVIEVGAVVEAKVVGEGSLVEINAKIGKGAVIGKHCKIGPACTVEENEILPDHTVIYGDGHKRVDNSGADDLKIRMVRRQVDVLRKLIPNSIAKWQ